MKKLLLVGLMAFIIFAFTGCEKGQWSSDIETVITNSNGIQLNYTDGSGFWIDKDDIKGGDGINMAQAIETYGNDYQVVELSKSDFLIVWDNVKLIFNNNECIGYVSLY